MKTTAVKVEIADLPQVKHALQHAVYVSQEIRNRLAEARKTLAGIDAGTILADDEGRTRTEIECDLLDDIMMSLNHAEAPSAE